MNKKLLTVLAATAFLAGLYGCGDSNSTSADPTPQSSAVVESSSAVIPEEPAVPSSSSVADTPANPEVSSSSATKNPSVGEVACGDLWCGETDTEGRVITGSPDETSGYWYHYEDDGFSHSHYHSHILYQLGVEEGYDNFFGPLIERDGGIKASVAIENDDEYHYAGWGFNIVSENQEGADITDWGGLCLVYSSTNAFELELRPEDEESVTGHNNFHVEVPSADYAVVDFPWSKFKQHPSWGYYGAYVQLEDVLKITSVITLKFTSSSDVLIRSIGRLGTCDNSGTYVPEFSSSSVKSSSSVETTGELKASFLWKGDDTEGRVITGSPDESSGYWYSYDDNYAPNNGDSRIVFPSDVEEGESGNFFSSIIVKYGGIKADIQIGSAYENGFAGLGFNIWNEDQEGVDVTKWEGVCLTYTSAESFYVELGIEDEASENSLGNLQVKAAASETVTTVNFPWNKFKQRGGWGCPGDCLEKSLKKIADIKLRFEESGEFLLKEIGSLDACGK